MAMLADVVLVNGYANMNATNFYVPFSFSIPKHSFEVSELFCRDHHRTIYFEKVAKKFQVLNSLRLKYTT